MTELGSAVSMSHNNIYKEQSIGIPLSLTNVKVIDNDSGDELTYGKEGELLVNSPGLMLGYYDSLEETERTIEYDDFGERWIHTGDLAKIDEDGFVFITGRIKRIYITKENDMAYKLFPQRMEEVIENIPQVMKCGVVVRPDNEKGNIPFVFVSLNSSEPNEKIEKLILSEVEKTLPSYYCPKKVVVLDDMPITSSQKIDYRILEKMEMD